MELGQKVFIGLSGGVDSSVSAALLKQANYEVIGVFIRVWEPHDETRGKPLAGYHCTWRAERRDAMRVAATIGIPLLTLDLRKEYKREVIDYLLAEYAAGRTPNPDVMCNKYIKFGAFYAWARKHGADYVATGHYAITRCKSTNKSTNTTNKRSHSLNSHEFVDSHCNCQLGTSLDNNKDQTYFLWTLTAEHLAHTLFPVGGYEKSQVRKLAKKFKLPVAEKKDSQGLCFIGQIDLKEFLKQHLASRSGKILNESGEVVGRHDGAVFYTIGQRHGFAVTKKTASDEPYYVVAKDIKKNTLTVSTRFERSFISGIIVSLKETNWINSEPEIGREYLARIRYRAPLLPCIVSVLKDKEKELEIKFAKTPDFIAPGQSLVLYDRTGQICLGGGVIK